MALTLVSPPPAAPISLAEMKAHLRADHDCEDAAIAGFVEAAREAIEARARISLIERTWSLSLDAWPCAPRLELPRPPVSAIVSIKTFDDDDAETLWPASEYRLDAASGRLAPRSGWPAVGRPIAGIEIRYVAGFGVDADTVPTDLRQAVAMLAAHFFEHRQATGDATAMPWSVASLIAPHIRHRL